MGYKKLKNNCIATLLIPGDALRVNAIGSYKCRCNKAEVLEIVDSARKLVNTASSNHNPEFIYETGKTVFVLDYDPSDRIECSTGIHFFMTKQEAEEY